MYISQYHLARHELDNRSLEADIQLSLISDTLVASRGYPARMRLVGERASKLALLSGVPPAHILEDSVPRLDVLRTQTGYQVDARAPGVAVGSDGGEYSIVSEVSYHYEVQQERRAETLVRIDLGAGSLWQWPLFAATGVPRRQYAPPREALTGEDLIRSVSGFLQDIHYHELPGALALLSLSEAAIDVEDPRH